jgi:hypothetical protein
MVESVNGWVVVAFALVFAASVTGLALKDVRAHGVNLAISIVMLVALLLHGWKR